MPESTVEIVDYDPAWPTLFEREAERMRAVVDDHVVSIEHVGSTAVPGLAAKPIVDVCPVIEDADGVRTVSDLLDDAGWPRARERGDAWVEHQRVADSGQEYNVRVRPREVAIERYLLVREYLRAHPDARDEYARIKRGAAETYPDDVERYTLAKSGTVERIRERAREAGYADRIDL
ncbi:GrpB family protein [Candidatus Halobonum tyrrellensis]|uniref:GrpB family protein n=1 Tax=Candidatus Halobonum tyrrellensis G22 TaxID=1324957 RepID=V4HAX9_9EURY|nr:GrpB family protein [Candidatus Halobonum tyrrellensis]ESP87835.1 hypothetical protein K933_12206 [Candidatus Halobonum tyrrellensis G22]